MCWIFCQVKSSFISCKWLNRSFFQILNSLTADQRSRTSMTLCKTYIYLTDILAVVRLTFLAWWVSLWGQIAAESPAWFVFPNVSFSTRDSLRSLYRFSRTFCSVLQPTHPTFLKEVWLSHHLPAGPPAQHQSILFCFGLFVLLCRNLYLKTWFPVEFT